MCANIEERRPERTRNDIIDDFIDYFGHRFARSFAAMAVQHGVGIWPIRIAWGSCPFAYCFCASQPCAGVEREVCDASLDGVLDMVDDNVSDNAGCRARFGI